jgi:hypothetical protein
MGVTFSSMPKRIPRRDPVSETHPEPPRRVPFALALQRDGPVDSGVASRLHARRQSRLEIAEASS